MRTGTLFRARALKNVFGGDALSRVENQVVLTPGVIVGEDFVGEAAAVHRDYVRAQVREILTPSPDRVTPECPGAGCCPGCAYMHWRHEAEQQTKLAQLREFLSPWLPAEAVASAMPEPAPATGYRNKLKLTMRKTGGTPQLGYTAPDGRCYEIRQCRLACAAINEKLSELYRDPGFFHTLHDRMTLTLRASQDGVTIFRNRPSPRLGLLREKVMERDFLVPPGGFFQVNPFGLAALTGLLREVLQKYQVGHLIDAYAGAGLFGAAAAATGVPRLTGVELDAASAEAARVNWRNFGAKEFDFRQGDSGALLPELLRKADGETLLVLDPPRGGLDGQTAQLAARAKNLALVVYISCHPATLTRDLGILHRGGLKPEFARMIDMFPRSAHMECFTLLRRAEK